MDRYDQLVKHAIYMRGQSTRVVREVAEYLQDLEVDILAQIENGLSSPRKSPAHINALLRQIQININQAFEEIGPELKGKLASLAEYETKYAATFLATVTSQAADDIVLLSRSALTSLVTDNPFDGKILSEWITDQSDSMRKSVWQQIRLGIGQGEDVSQMSRRLKGLTAGAEGAFKLNRRQTEAMVRTAVNHTSNEAFRLTFAENEVEKYQISAVLDSRTSKTCAGLDGKIFSMDDPKRMIPPFHPNCRTIVVPVLDDEPFESTYGDWLKRQDENTQRKVLGPARFRIWKGGEPLGNFIDNEGHVLTLEQLGVEEGISI